MSDGRGAGGGCAWGHPRVPERSGYGREVGRTAFRRKMRRVPAPSGGRDRGRGRRKRSERKSSPGLTNLAHLDPQTGGTDRIDSFPMNRIVLYNHYGGGRAEGEL